VQNPDRDVIGADVKAEFVAARDLLERRDMQRLRRGDPARCGDRRKARQVAEV
jgi:hypothetical protein